MRPGRGGRPVHASLGEIEERGRRGRSAVGGHGLHEQPIPPHQWRGNGNPIVGERVYSRHFTGPEIPAPRLMLHAAELGFVHPATNLDVRFEEPLPTDFEETLARLRR